MLMRSTRWGAVLLLGLLLLLSAAASAEDGGDGLSETAEDWDDVLDALEPFHREEAELCAACTFVSDRINAKWTRHAYKLKKWSAKKKLKMDSQDAQVVEVSDGDRFDIDPQFLKLLLHTRASALPTNTPGVIFIANRTDKVSDVWKVHLIDCIPL